MSKADPDSAARLSSADASAFERRLLDAATRDRPSPELSARMASAIGVSLPTTGAPGGLSKTGATAPQGASVAGSVAPWLSGALVAAVVAGAFVVGREAPAPPTPSAALSVAARPPVIVPSVAPESPSVEPGENAQRTGEEPTVTAPLQAPRVRSQAPVAELAAQVALVDSARRALAAGQAERALVIVRDYQMDYPSGAFRPEVSAIKIEALLKLGRKTEARALAERFVKTHGPGPLSDRVARLGGLARP